jgi:hypothetical protein
MPGRCCAGHRQPPHLPAHHLKAGQVHSNLAASSVRQLYCPLQQARVVEAVWRGDEVGVAAAQPSHVEPSCGLSTLPLPASTIPMLSPNPPQPNPSFPAAHMRRGKPTAPPQSPRPAARLRQCVGSPPSRCAWCACRRRRGCRSGRWGPASPPGRPHPPPRASWSW